MKILKLIIFGLALSMLSFLLAVEESNAAVIPPNSKILVVYFSRAGEQFSVGEVTKGNTAVLAEMIARSVNADLYEIKPVKSYPMTYNELTQVAKEEKSKNVRPAISGKVSNFDKYDVVFVGFPIWYGDLPMPVYTFLESNNFSNKTIVPFCTHEGSGIAGLSVWIKAATHAKYVHRGFAMHGYYAQCYREEAKQEVAKWIKSLKL